MLSELSPPEGGALRQLFELPKSQRRATTTLQDEVKPQGTSGVWHAGECSKFRPYCTPVGWAARAYGSARGPAKSLCCLQVYLTRGRGAEFDSCALQLNLNTPVSHKLYQLLPNP